jgi:NADH:ubiquinone oxidoreductase subunit 4 (subunit M)
MSLAIRSTDLSERSDMPETWEWDAILMTLVVFIPSVFALGLLFFPRGQENAMRWWSLIGTALTLGVSLWMFFWFKNDTVDLAGVVARDVRARASLSTRAEEADNLAVGAPARSRDWVSRYPWIKEFHIDYYLGADGISMALVLLTTALSFLAMIASWKIDKFVRGYCILFLVLETGMLGTFLALDFFLFYIFWEVMLLPMYFLIGVWGGPRREYAAIKFFLYTLLGSVFILIAILAFYFTNVRDFVPPDRLALQVGDQGGEAYQNAKKAVNAAEEERNKVVNEAPQAVTDFMMAQANLMGAETDLTGARAAYDAETDAKKKADLKADLDKARAKRDEARAAVEKTQGAGQKAMEQAAQQRAEAERKLRIAEIKRDTELAKAPAVVNTFDIMLLQRVGKAAQQHLHGEKVSTPAVEAAEKVVAEVRENVKQGVSGWTEADVKTAEEYAAAARKGLDERINSEAFFSPAFQYTMFLFLLVGFAIKVPVFPFHTWLPDAHVEAPTPISMILAGVLLKMGGYGIIRIAYPICPWAAEMLAFLIALFGIINIVYGAFTAMAQTDFKKLVAYSSISHMGYVILGVAVWSTGPNTTYWSWGMNGAVFQMVAHGITSAGMFFLVGVIYDRAHHRNLDNFRGLYEPMPLYGGISAVIFFAAMGLPGMCGFVGEFMVVLSAWNFAPGGYQWVGIAFSILAALTVVLTAAYILWTLQRVFMGQNPAYKNYKDMDVREFIAAAPLVVLAVLLGVAPFLVLNWLEPSVTGLIDMLASFK